MNFSTPSRVLTTIRAGDNAEWNRGENRTKINNAANCVPQLDAAMAKKLGLKVNVNWGELMNLLANARRQYRRAFYNSQFFFNIGMPYAPPQYQQDWQLFVTDQINRKMRDSLKYFEAFESMTSAVCCHGVGPKLWYEPNKWCADYVAIEDLRVATDTTLDFQNLDWFAVRKQYTPGELAKKALRKGSRWNQPAIFQMLKNKKNQNWDFAANTYDWETQPEKFAELMKQDGGYYMGDAMPTFPLWHFYFKDDTSDDPTMRGWWRKVVPASGSTNQDPDKFLWESDKPIAAKREHLLCCQFGDLSNKAPFLYHSVRSLGFALLEPTFYSNLTRCRFMQHVHDLFNVWLRVNDPGDKGRALVQEFANLQVVRPGVSVVPQSERHQIQGDLVELAMAQTKQLQQEASSSYTSNTDTGTSREQTAFETSVKVEQVNAMLGGLLIKSFMYAKLEYTEICRRFCMDQPTDDPDEDIIDVQEACHEYGIPKQFMNSKRWIIEPVTPLGMGNPVLARSAAKELLEIRPLLDPTAQQEALHEIVLTVTGDPRKAARWVPLGQNRGITDASRDAQAMFGTLMQGVEVPPREGLSPIDQVDSMLPLLAGKITMLTQRDNTASADEAAGMMTVLNYINQLVQLIAQDPQEAQRVKQYGDSLGQLQNEIKALAQRGAEKAQAQQAQNGQNGEMQANIQAKIIDAQTKSQIAHAKAAQKAEMDSQKFVRDQRRQDAGAFAEIGRQQTIADAQAENERAKPI
jgi:hypothetical protein